MERIVTLKLLGALVFFCLACSNTFGVVSMNCTSDEVFTYDDIFVVEDSLAIYNTDSVDSMIQAGDFFKSYINNRVGSTYWVRLAVKNECVSVKGYLIELNDPHISYLEIFDGDSSVLKAGYMLPFKNRDLKYKNFAYNFVLFSGETKVFYLKIKSDLHSVIVPSIKTVKSFTSYYVQEYYVLGLFYGVILILAIYNFLLFIKVREWSYLFYVIYALVCALCAFSEDGLGFQFLWSGLPQFNYFVSIGARSLLLISFIFYGLSFLEIKRFSFLEKNGLIATSVLAILASLSSIIFDFQGLVWHVLYLSPYGVMYFIAYKRHQEGRRSARFFMLGNSIILVSFLVFVARINSWIPTNVFSVYVFDFAFLIEAVVLSLALAEKLKQDRDEKEIAQIKLIEQLEANELLKDQVNRELESKVKQRTVQLEEKKGELELTVNELNNLKEELYKMNSEMDKMNYRLQKEVQTAKKNLVLGTKVSTEEFMAFFPDKNACVRYMFDLKHQKGFKCRKCGNAASKEGSEKYQKVCTKCNFPESVTVNTLFHGVRFPLDKAFYIAYTTWSQEKMSVDHLSEILDLRRNTCWAFRKKVETILEGVKRKVSFEELVLEDLKKK